MTYTVDSARAALALGPVSVRCNTCGDVHELGRGGFEHAPIRAECMRRRAGRGVQRAYCAHREQLLSIIDALECLSALALDYSLEWPHDRFVFWGAVVNVMEPLRPVCRLRSESPDHIWFFSSLAYLQGDMQRSHILPFYSASEWMLMPSAEQADEHIARVYLQWACGGVQWADFEVVRESFRFPEACADLVALHCELMARRREQVLSNIDAPPAPWGQW